MKRSSESVVIDRNGDFVVNELSEQEYLLKSISHKIDEREYDEAFLQVDAALSSGGAEDPIFMSKLTILRAMIYNSNRNWNDAMADLETALAIDPYSCDALVLSSRVYFNIRKYKESADYIIQACKINVDHETFFGVEVVGEAMDLTDRLSGFGEYELALLVLDQLKLLTNLEYIEKSRLYNLILLGRDNEAKEILRKVDNSIVSDLIFDQFEGIDEKNKMFAHEGLAILKFLYRTSTRFRDEVIDFMFRNLQANQLAFADVKEILFCTNSLQLLGDWMLYIPQQNTKELNLALARSSNISTLKCGINELLLLSVAIMFNRSITKVELYFASHVIDLKAAQELYKVMMNSKSVVHWIFHNQEFICANFVAAVNDAVYRNRFITFVSPYNDMSSEAHQAILDKSTRSQKCFDEYRASPFQFHPSFSQLDRYVLSAKLEDYCNDSKPKVDAEAMRTIHDYVLNKKFLVAMKKIFQKCVVDFDAITNVAKCSGSMLIVNDAKRTVYLPDNVYEEIAKYFVNAVKIAHIGIVEDLERKCPLHSKPLAHTNSSMI